MPRPKSGPAASLAVLLGITGAPLHAQVLDDVEARRDGRDAIVTVRFAAPVQLVRTVAARSGDLAQVYYDVLATGDALNLVTTERYHGTTLTPEGRKVALETLRHHRLIETYLAEALGYDWHDVHDEAERLEHVISEDFEARIADAQFRGDEVVFVSTGDGTTSQGEFWESMNTASNLKLPVVYFVEDNGYAISVHVEVNTAGGSISAEHGIGTLKRDWLGHARSAEEIALMRTIKQALDPRGLLNPGKVL